MNITTNVDPDIPVISAPHSSFECCGHEFPFWTVRIGEEEYIINEWSFSDYCLDEDGGPISDEAEFYDERSPYAWDEDESVKTCLEELLTGWLGLDDDATVEVTFV